MPFAIVPSSRDREMRRGQLQPLLPVDLVVGFSRFSSISFFKGHSGSKGQSPAAIAGRPHFVSETVTAYEIGYRAQSTSRVSSTVSGYYNDYDRLLSWGTMLATLLPIIFENNLDAKAYGFEVNADIQICGWWRINAGFDLLREHVRTKPEYFDFQNSFDETADPKHQFAFHSVMDFPSKVELGIHLRWVDTLHNNNGGLPRSVPAYTELDNRLGLHISQSVEVALIGRNLLHAQRLEYGPIGPAREELQRSAFARILCSC